jgi:enamine deaminase RidA (YjgF/YER057c/UK114 family)
METPDERLQRLNYVLPQPPKPMAIYVPTLEVNQLLFVSGHGPLRSDGTLVIGRVGADLSLEQGAEAAELTALAIIATVRQALGGTLQRVKRLVKSFGLVRCTPEFNDHPAVINGYSRIMREVFGEVNGVGTRTAVGTNALPGGMAVEVDCIFELFPEGTPSASA